MAASSIIGRQIGGLSLPCSLLPAGVMLLAWVAQPALGQFEVGNGGDAVRCAAAPSGSPSYGYEGLFSLDFLATGGDGDAEGAAPLATATSWTESAARITSVLEEKLPELAPGFKRFVANYGNKDPQRPYVWEAAPFGLIELKDERLAALLPENCRSGAEPKLIQAAIRQRPSFTGSQSFILFKFDPKLLSQLDQTAPVQLSMILVHEWLWDFSANVDRNRRVNRLLHSRELEDLPRAEIVGRLKAWGFHIPGVEPEYYDPESCQGYDGATQEFILAAKPQSLNDMAAWTKFGIHERQQNCTTDQDPECYAPVESDDFVQRHTRALRVLKLFLTKRELTLSTAGQMENPYRHTTCTFVDERGRVTCSEFQSSNGHPYVLAVNGAFANTGGNRMELEGYVTPECMRLAAHGRIFDILAETWWSEYDFVFERRFP
jgi:hypothetical protein